MKRYRQLTLDERYQIQTMLALRMSQVDIARELDRSPSTISREIARNSDWSCLRPYEAKRAQRKLGGRRRAKGAAARKIQGELQVLVEAKLRLSWSPEQISGRLRLESGIQLSHETIYQHVLRDQSGLRYCLRYGGYKHHRFKKSKHALKTALWRKLLDQRPRGANERTELGHWERDLVEGTRTSAASILTIVDRKSRFTRLRRVIGKNTAHVARETIEAIAPFHWKNRTITNDNGREFQQGREFERSTGLPVFYTAPAAPWQRGTVENMNGLIRQYFPKRTSLDGFPAWFEEAIEESLNHRPRKCLDYRTPHEVFYTERMKLLSPEMQLGLESSPIT